MKKLFFSLLAFAATLGTSAEIVSGTDYLIQNVQTGYYFAGGRDYGTHGTLLAKPQFFTFTTNGSGYSLDSHQYNNATSHFLGTNLYVDGGATAWNVVETSTPGVYTIENGGNYLAGDGFNVNIKTVKDANDAAAQWKLISKADALATAGEGTLLEPSNATVLIKNPEIKRNASTSWYPTWTITNYAGDGNPGNFAQGGGGAVANCAESYMSNNGFKATQAITEGVKAGVYRLDAQAFYQQRGDNANVPSIYLNDQSAVLPFNSAKSGSMAGAYTDMLANKWPTEPLYVRVEEGGSLTITVSSDVSSCWTIFGEMSLTYYGDCTVAEAQNVGTVKEWNAYVAAKDEVAGTLDEAGKASYNTAKTAIATPTSPEALATAKANLDAALRAAALAQTTPGADMTLAIINPSFETGNMNGWTAEGNGGAWALMTRANAGDPKVGTYWYEKFGWSGKIDVNQTITGLRGGHYRVTLLTLDQAGKTKLVANDAETTISGGSASVHTVDVMLDDNSDLKIGIYCANHDANKWVGFDDFHLTYVSAEFPALPAVVEGKMNAAVAAAQTAAVAAYNENQTAANYNAAVAAIAAAQASKAQYETVAANLTKANEILNSTNVYTAEARTQYETTINGVQTKYDNGTFADADMADANAIVGPANYTKPKNVMTTYVASAWSATNGVNVYTNDWSWEGGQDGNSGLTTPFIENWVADAQKLANTEVSATMTELPNGLYRFTADVRLLNNKTGDDAGFDGITFFANDVVPAMPEATTYPDGNLYQISIEALVKDGNLKMGYTVENTNVSWVAMKNVKYTKVRDLTPEEEAVVPTAIALNKTEAALDAANNTTTLEVTYTPADATEGIVWTTSDANVATVADGVVTGVAPGTATITATSTLDANVQATCVVTVEYPETAYETTIEEVDADNEAQINVTTLSSTNLIKNGSFEYPNGYYGFTYGNAAAVNPISSTGFEIVEDNGNHYLKAKASGGGATDKSLCTAWPIENGKSYVFSFDIKANKSCTTDLQYIGTSLSNTTSEDGNHKFANVPAYGTEWQTVKYQFTNSDNLKYLVFNSRWMGAEQSFDNFYLVEVADMSIIGNVDYATSLIPTVNVGDAAFQYSQDAIDATNALVKGTATVQEVEDAIEAMTTLNEPAAGDKFHVAITFSGYRYSGHALESNGTSGVTVPLADNTANNNYPNDWTFTPVAGTKNGFTMSITTTDNTYYVCTGAQDNGANESQIRMTTDPAKALTIVISPAKSQEGVYYLNNSRASNASIGCQDDRASNGGWYTTGNHNTHTITPATKATATLKITDAQYGTFIAPFDAEKPEGVTVYTVSATEGDVLTLTEAGDIKANTAYVVYAESVVEENLNGWGLATKDSYTSILLTGTYVQIDAPNGSYVLQNHEGVVGFYQVDTEKATPKVGANRAYLTVESNARVLTFGGDETAIKAIDALTSGKAEIYDLNGRKLNRLQKGINIVNGVKVLVK